MIKFLISSILLAQNLAEMPDIKQQPKAENFKKVKVIKGGVSAIDMLPEEIYGKWSVTSVLTQTTNSEDFKTRTSDIWIFKRFGDHIVLTNPATKASASITVDEVTDNKAVFSRATGSPSEKERETVQILIDGDNFVGIDTFVIEKYDNGKLILQDVVKYKLQGNKISGQESIFKQ